MGSNEDDEEQEEEDNVNERTKDTAKAPNQYLISGTFIYRQTQQSRPPSHSRHNLI